MDVPGWAWALIGGLVTVLLLLAGRPRKPLAGVEYRKQKRKQRVKVEQKIAQIEREALQKKEELKADGKRLATADAQEVADVLNELFAELEND